MPSSPPLRWTDLAGARVGIWGLGAEGEASRRRLDAMGVPAVLVDDHAGRGALVTGSGGLEALGSCEVVLKSPGISRYRPDVTSLEGGGTAVVGGLGLWLEGADRDRVICVTGTKGKSTTVSVMGHLMRRLGKSCFIGGNLGDPPWDPDAPTDVDAWVIETSSFQVTDLWSGPPVVGVTSLHPDHLDWHGTEEQYFRDKLSLCTLPGVRTVIANGDDPLLRARLGPRVDFVSDLGESWISTLGLRGAHNRINALLARALLSAFGVSAVDDPIALDTAATGFEGLPSRLQTIATIDGVEFVDDSLSTNVLPTVAALSVFDNRRVALLVGGYDRDIDYSPLASYIAAREQPLLVLCMPDSGERIRAAIEAKVRSRNVEVESCGDLDDAVGRGFSWAQPDGVVLLSPAAPSFGRFANYAARASAFVAAAYRCST
jgi:UDP-N-acetylmuramoylalanine--D-glutamate ligase